MGQLTKRLEVEMNNTQEPPLGLKPRYLVAEKRMIEICDAITGYALVGQSCPKIWIAELAGLNT